MPQYFWLKDANQNNIINLCTELSLDLGKKTRSGRLPQQETLWGLLSNWGPLKSNGKPEGREIKMRPVARMPTNLQSTMNAKFIYNSFRPSYENGVINMIPMIPHAHRLYESFESASFFCGLVWTRISLKPQHREADLKVAYSLWGIVRNVFVNPLSWQCQNLCWLNVAIIIDWRVKCCNGPNNEM